MATLGPAMEGGIDAGMEAGMEAGIEAGMDAGIDKFALISGAGAGSSIVVEVVSEGLEGVAAD